MTNDNYYNEFLGDDLENSDKDQLPGWVSGKNSSLKAYTSIEKLKKIKKAYIRRHNLKSQYTKKSAYLILKSEVARLVGVNPQPLFNTCSYSESLTRHLTTINMELEKAKANRVKNQGGLRQKRKQELIRELQLLQKKEKDLLVETIDTVYERTLSNLPLPIRRKLELL